MRLLLLLLLLLLLKQFLVRCVLPHLLQLEQTLSITLFQTPPVLLFLLLLLLLPRLYPFPLPLLALHSPAPVVLPPLLFLRSQAPLHRSLALLVPPLLLLRLQQLFIRKRLHQNAH